MFKYEKNIVRREIEKPNPQYTVLVQEQPGGGNGELKTALQYISQNSRIKEPQIKDLFLDIGAEELSHMEIVGTLIHMLNGHDIDYKKVGSGKIQAHVINSLVPEPINTQATLGRKTMSPQGGIWRQTCSQT